MEVWSYPLAPTGNPYAELYTQGLRAIGWDVHHYSPGALSVRRTPAVLHVHWPEQAASARNATFARVKSALFLHEVRRVRRRGGRVIWTGHNVWPHEHERRRLRTFERFLVEVDGVLHLSHAGAAAVEAAHPRLADVPAAVVPLGDLSAGYAPLPDRSEARTRLGVSQDALVLINFGRDRVYKAIDRLSPAFDQSGLGRDAVLILAGSQAPNADADPRIRVIPGFVPDAQLLDVIAASDTVVFAFSTVLHSASVCLSLALGRPVLAPRVGSLGELQDEVGPEWLRLYDGPMDAAVIDAAATWMQATRGAPPVVSRLTWPEIATVASSALYGAP